MARFYVVSRRKRVGEEETRRRQFGAVSVRGFLGSEMPSAITRDQDVRQVNVGEPGV
jgi:hypothetical protein